MKNRLLFYSECYIFGGSEVLLVNLMNDTLIGTEYERHFAYAYNADYQKGVDRLPRNAITTYPVRILSNGNLFHKLNSMRIHRYFSKIIKLPFILLEQLGLYTLYNYVRLYFLFKKIKPEILHLNNGGYPAAKSCIVAVFSARTARIRNIIMTVNNIAEKQKGIIEKYVDKYVAAKVSCFITASSLAKEKLHTRRKIPANKILQVYNGVAADRAKKSREAVLSEHNIPLTKFVIVNVAFLTERKGQEYLLHALGEIRNADADLFQKMTLLIIGEGEQRGFLEGLIKKYEINEKVILTGHRDDYIDYINAADAFVLSSVKDEDMPLVTLSAMSLEKAIIATKVAGVVEQIRDGVEGILVDPKDTVGLAMAISVLYHQPGLRRQLGAASKNRFTKLFSVQTMASKYLNIYNKLIGWPA